MINLAMENYFCCPVYTADASEFLDTVREVSEEYLAKARVEQQLNEIYPVYMSGGYSDDPRLEKFTHFVSEAARAVLDSQGYDMSNFAMRFSEMWTQEHHKHSAMEQHVHGGSHVVGFYFLDVPENDNTRVVLHDPRAGKVMIDLPQKDMSVATTASQMINFTPAPGLIILTNAWLPHSFTRHSSDKPLRFVHFNLHPQLVACPTQAEVV